VVRHAGRRRGGKKEMSGNLENLSAARFPPAKATPAAPHSSPRISTSHASHFRLGSARIVYMQRKGYNGRRSGSHEGAHGARRMSGCTARRVPSIVRLYCCVWSAGARRAEESVSRTESSRLATRLVGVEGPREMRRRSAGHRSHSPGQEVRGGFGFSGGVEGESD
jgi:hypothetical protein